jgi:hypothetical protein
MGSVLTLRHPWRLSFPIIAPYRMRGDLVTGREVEERSVSAPSTGAASE